MGLLLPASNKKVWILSLGRSEPQHFLFLSSLCWKSSILDKRNWETWAHTFYSATNSQDKSIMPVLGAQAKNTESCLPCSSLLSEQRLYAEKGNSRRPEPLPLLVPPSQSRKSIQRQKTLFPHCGFRVLVHNLDPAESQALRTTSSARRLTIWNWAWRISN